MANTESEEPASAMDEAKDKGILSGTNLEHDEAEGRYHLSFFIN